MADHRHRLVFSDTGDFWCGDCFEYGNHFDGDDCPDGTHERLMAEYEAQETEEGR